MQALPPFNAINGHVLVFLLALTVLSLVAKNLQQHFLLHLSDRFRLFMRVQGGQVNTELTRLVVHLALIQQVILFLNR